MFNINHILQTSGHITSLALLGGIIFLESGIPVGFFLPGDTLLFTAGFFSAQHYLPLGWLLISVVVAKQLGSQVGYLIGATAGHKLFKKKDSLFFNKEYLVKSHDFYQKHGGKAVTLGQFLPVIRTFAPVVAGIAAMKKRSFFIFNLAGAVFWGIGVILLGYWLGNKVPNIDKYLLPAVIVAMIFSFSPALWHLFGKKANRQKIWNSIKRTRIK